MNMEDVTVERPAANAVYSTDHWIPYANQQSLATCTPQIDYVDQIHAQQVSMVEIMAPLGYAL